MAKQWKCDRCSTKNDESTLTCSNCRMIRGAVVVPGSFSSSPDPSPTPSPTWPTTADREPTSEPGEPGVTYWTTGVEPSDEPSTRPLWRRIPPGWIVVAVIVLGTSIAGALFNASRSSTGEITREGDMMATDLRVGDCFDLKDPAADEITDVTARPCTDEHEYELFFTGSMPEGVYPAEEAFDAFFEERCVSAFDAYIGKAYADSELDIYWLYPLQEAWSSGDRSIQCATYHPRVHRLTGSLKGSNR